MEQATGAAHSCGQLCPQGSLSNVGKHFQFSQWAGKYYWGLVGREDRDAIKYSIVHTQGSLQCKELTISSVNSIATAKFRVTENSSFWCLELIHEPITDTKSSNILATLRLQYSNSFYVGNANTVFLSDEWVFLFFVFLIYFIDYAIIRQVF